MTHEKRLIDANALIAEYDRVHIGESGKARKLMEDAPTVDDVEVVHGRWIVSGCGFDCCSECRKVYADGYLTAMGIKARTQFNYCPNCGAKMDGGNEDG